MIFWFGHFWDTRAKICQKISSVFFLENLRHQKFILKLPDIQLTCRSRLPPAVICKALMKRLMLAMESKQQLAGLEIQAVLWIHCSNLPSQTLPMPSYLQTICQLFFLNKDWQNTLICLWDMKLTCRLSPPWLNKTCARLVFQLLEPGKNCFSWRTVSIFFN